MVFSNIKQQGLTWSNGGSKCGAVTIFIVQYIVPISSPS